MITDEQRVVNEQTYRSLVEQLGIDTAELFNYLGSVDYFSSPATTQFFGSYVGGLCEHALRLYYLLYHMVSIYFPGRYSTEDVMKVALFKDVYKAEMYEIYKKNVQDPETDEWHRVSAFRVRDNKQSFGDVGVSSFMRLRNILQFTDEQAAAILYGGKTNFNDTYDVHSIISSFPLVALTRSCDMIVSYCYDSFTQAQEYAEQLQIKAQQGSGTVEEKEVEEVKDNE